eukprot:CAMPEP_0172734438 /NCGR_PEP_ID=MMETSP1074-20121228/109912_1 /TAXON_ID=2916 /ORGANISM="Ceratium fusus, Strain PA161109" /LENGTH=34 /DNA_ID= /DNA_START= /DNA_END= /DNA_ORIENTATION=
MADKHNAPFKLVQRNGKALYGLKVQVVRRFIQEQ